MPSILFVCTANQFRSPLAAASFLNYLEQNNNNEDWKVESAGTWTTNGRQALLVTRQNAERLGLASLVNHSSRRVSVDLLSSFDLIIVMEAGHKEALNAEFKAVRGRIFMLTEVVSGELSDIPDPIVLGTPADEVATELHTMIQSGAEKIIDLARTISAKRNNS